MIGKLGRETTLQIRDERNAIATADSCPNCDTFVEMTVQQVRLEFTSRAPTSLQQADIK